MSNIDTIKERVRKLMAVANDGNAPEAEIDSAMRLAAKLLDQHHIDASEIGQEGKDEDLKMGRTFATSQASKFSTWEGVLGHAICKLFGCVQHYLSNDKAPIRANGFIQVDKDGSPKYGKKLCFYGPAVESAEAASLFQEWSASIATMGVARWGGCFRGDGGAYCYGFATALRNKAYQIDKDRQQIQARPVVLLAGTVESGNQSTAITLSGRYEILRDMGKTYLKTEHNVDLHNRGGGSGYANTGGDAYREGRQHGTSAHFGRSAKRKMLT